MGKKRNPDADLLSRLLGNTIGAESLTTVFGMGTGVSFLLLAPGLKNSHKIMGKESG